MAAPHGGRAAASTSGPAAAARPHLPPQCHRHPPFSAIHVSAHKNSRLPSKSRAPGDSHAQATGETDREEPGAETDRAAGRGPGPRRLTSDMISFRATVIPAAGADVSLLDADALARDSQRAHKLQLDRRPRRHTDAGSTAAANAPTASTATATRHSELAQRFSAIKIEAVPPSTAQATATAKRASSYMYSRASSFTFGSHNGGNVVAGYSFIPDETPAPEPEPPASSICPQTHPVTYTGNGKTVFSAFSQTARRLPDAPALLVLPSSSHNPAAPPTVRVTWSQLHAKVLRTACALLRLGFSPGEGLVVCAGAGPDAFALHLAALALGGHVAHVRSSWRAVDLAGHIFPAARARVLVLDRLADNFAEAVERHSQLLRAVVVLGEDQDPVDLLLRVRAPVNVLTMADVAALAADADAKAVDVERLADRVSPAQCCALEFGLDASGLIRGVQLSHDNVLFTAATLAQSCGPLSSADRVLGYLPLHHVASQVLELFLPLVVGLSVTCVAIGEGASLKQAIAAARPTALFATPATWAHVGSQVYRAKRDANSLLYRWAKARAASNAKKQLIARQQQQREAQRQSQSQSQLKLKRSRGRPAPRSLGYLLAQKLVLNAIKRKLGLESCAACFSVLAPLDFELERLFQTVDLPVYQLDGTAETSGFAAINCPGACELGSAGRALRGTVLRCDERTQDVLLRGRNVFMGYVRARLVDEDDVQEPTDDQEPSGCDDPSDGWFTLYQRGFLAPDGFLKLHDPRDFVVLSTGDWVPLRPLERAIAAGHPELERAVLVGDGRAFLSVLLFLQTVPALPSPAPVLLPPLPAGQLGEDALQVSRRIGSSATNVADAVRCQAWAVHLDALLESLAERSAVAAAGFRVRKWMLMASPFAVETGEIDPDSGDVKRRVVERKYQALLDSLYS